MKDSSYDLESQALPEDDRGRPRNQILTWMGRFRDSGLIKVLPKNYSLLAFVLYSYRDPSGNCWPKQATLAKNVGCHLNTIKAAVKVLKVCLGIKVTKHGRKNVYFLPFNEAFDKWQPTRKKKRRKKRQ